MTQPRSERDIFARVVTGSPIPAALGKAMVSLPDPSSVRRRWGMVNAINSDGTLNVNVAGIIIPSIRHLATYAPTVGERVTLDVVGTDTVVVGAITPSPLNDYDSRINSVTSRVTAVENIALPLDDLAEAHYYQSVVQSIPNLTNTIVSFDGVARSTPSVTPKANGAGHAFTINRSGVWYAGTTIRYVGTAGGGERYASLLVGADVRAGQSTQIPTNMPTVTCHCSFTERLTAGEDVSVQLWQDSGGALNLDPAGNIGWVSIHLAWIRP